MNFAPVDDNDRGISQEASPRLRRRRRPRARGSTRRNDGMVFPTSARVKELGPAASRRSRRGCSSSLAIQTQTAASNTYRVAELLGEPVRELLDSRGDLIERHRLLASIALDDVETTHLLGVFFCRTQRRTFVSFFRGAPLVRIFCHDRTRRAPVEHRSVDGPRRATLEGRRCDRRIARRRPTRADGRRPRA